MTVQTLAADGAWCWFNNPRAIEADGLITFGAISSGGDAQIWQYNRAAGTTQSFTLQAGEPEDDHAVPSLCFLPDGRIITFWTEHSVAGVPVKYRISTNPNDITAWGCERTMPAQAGASTRYCYPDPVVVPEDGRLYLFWRQGVYPGPMCISWTTLSDLVNWEPAHILIQNSADNERPYWHVDYDGHGGINIAITDGSPNTTTNNVYFANLHRDPSNNRLALWGQTTLGPDHKLLHYVANGPMEVQDLDVVQHASIDDNGWVWDLAHDSNGHPCIATVGLASPNDQYARYITWVTGTGWTNNQITDMGGTIADPTREPNYSPGYCLDHEDPYTAYIARMMSTGHREIRKYVTADSGATWTATAITSDSPVDNLRPVMPRGATDGVNSLLWMRGSYAHWTDYNTAIVKLSGPPA